MLPIERPGKIVCVGMNYRAHAEEQGREPPGQPVLFAKWASALIGPGEGFDSDGAALTVEQIDGRRIALVRVVVP